MTDQEITKSIMLNQAIHIYSPEENCTQSGAMSFISPPKTPISAANLLNDHLLPFLKEQGVGVSAF